MLRMNIRAMIQIMRMFLAHDVTYIIIHLF
jgi:hypothetical protein